ncbi:MAG TPA: nitroreductase family protein [Alphaproteobacteria bacterium]|nr:nitroreductase family protein [Alphaproteobacteria bacterium]
MELYEVMRTTFAARDFTDEDVPDSVLYEIFDNARFAPSGGNRQGNHAVVVRDLATKQALSKLAEPAAKRYTAQRAAGESPWNTIIPTKLTEKEIDATEPARHLTSTFVEAPVVLVFGVDLRVVASMDAFVPRVGVISGASIYPFVWNVLLAARNVGYGGTITTLTSAEEPKVQELLGFPPHVAVAAAVPLGKPVKQLTRLKRRPVEDIVKLERFDGAPLKG